MLLAYQRPLHATKRSDWHASRAEPAWAVDPRIRAGSAPDSYVTSQCSAGCVAYSWALSKTCCDWGWELGESAACCWWKPLSPARCQRGPVLSGSSDRPCHFCPASVDDFLLLGCPIEIVAKQRAGSPVGCRTRPGFSGGHSGWAVCPHPASWQNSVLQIWIFIQYIYDSTWTSHHPDTSNSISFIEVQKAVIFALQKGL